MMDGWKEIRIGDFGRVITGKTPPTSERKYFDGKYNFISPKDMKFDSRYIKSSLTTITSEAIKKFKNQVIPKNTVMFTALSYGFGKIGLADNVCLTNQQINSIVVDGTQHDFNFVYYLLRNSKDYFLTFNAGIVTPIISKSTFEKIKVIIPKKKETQYRIANILSAYDNLIENNLKRIKLLEEMAQKTYEEWFVRFKFPGHETAVFDEESGLPEGWKKVKLSSIAEFLNGFAFAPHHWFEDGIPIIKIKEMKNGISKETPRNSGKKIPTKYLVNNGDILFSWSATLEVILWNEGVGLLNQHLFKVIPKNEYPKSLVYFHTKNSLPIFNNLTTGATMKHIKRKELDFVKVIIPNNNLVAEIDKILNAILEEILNLHNQNQRLKEARDILLPRLMTGIITIND